VISVGVDIAEERKGLDLVALDGGRRIVASHGRLSVSDVRQRVLDLGASVVCIDGPSGWSTSGRSRAAERRLRQLGISSFATGVDPGDHPFYRWMRVGIRLFDELSDLYPLYRGGIVEGTTAEVFPAASAALLAGELRPRHETKNRFRRRVLRDRGVTATGDAGLPNIDRVDAALAALTGVEAIAGSSSWVGDPDEGVVLLPTPLPATPLTARRADPGLLRSGALTTAAVHPRCCECGCGAEVRRRFLPGHDAKLKSTLRRRASAGDRSAAHRLECLGWS
jgi:predicted nuclease with RNAse H fold